MPQNELHMPYLLPQCIRENADETEKSKIHQKLPVSSVG